ncbi:putative zinc finger protein [Tripterygium wilfordii]|uniref:Putative zinc finger protein n=1 Tax=Tripterygium wilfordii TaxID=458696 RepID=A0A7J7BUN8_TRIWF|nr:zinc finger protein ZAT4 [Tripterygium wilfordii]KAF5725395.1 putative zinc finger protein [Tripterygium wilfordii]
MEEDQAQRHIYRLCNKSFSSGKALGGHMRVHDALNPVEEEVKLNKCKLGFEVKENSGYGLRENPRKSSKFASLNSTAPSIEERVCGMCGREFMSLRGLSGHMRMHKKDRTVSKDTRTSSRCNLFVESLWESEAVNLVRRGSNRLRSKMSSNSSLSSLNGSYSDTETVDNLDKAANCLMMMSRGVHNWGELVSGCEFKGNNSESFKLKSSFENKQIATDGNAIFDGVRPPERKKHKVEKSDPKLYEEPEIEKVIHDGRKCSSTTVESSDQLMDDIDLNVTGLESMKLGKNSGRKKTPYRRKCISPDSEIFDDSGRRDEFQCNYCDKVFRTCRALGGHQTLHRKQKSIVAMEVDNCSGNRLGDCVPETYVNAKLAELKGTEDSMEQEIVGVILMNKGSVDSNVHNCPICFKEFASGQALGGHKRVHSAKNSGTSKEQIAQKKQDLSDMSSMLDLNMPAMPQEEDSDNGGSETTSRMSE